MLKAACTPRRTRRLTPQAQRTLLGVLCFLVACLFVTWNSRLPSRSTSTVATSTHVHAVRTGHGGKWHIPQTWIDNDDDGASACDGQMMDIIDAAECALHLAIVNGAVIENTNIPLIAHQTSRSADAETWSSIILGCIERWLTAATGWDGPSHAPMAWLLWDDSGIDALVQKYERDFYPAFSALPYPVEKADAFRVLVVKWFGGIYGDIDSKPLRHPSDWVRAGDLDDWFDGRGNRHARFQPRKLAYVIPDDAPSSYTAKSGISQAAKKFAKTATATATAVGAIFGIEADSPPDPDDAYWRMGYAFPVQVTNWALAMAPHHPIANQFLSHLESRIRANVDTLPRMDPLNITGPPALTHIVKEHAESSEPDLDWQSLSSLDDRSNPPGGRSKIVAGDVLILPITGFSPGRGRFHNMGSQPTTHPSARVQHMAAGSWKKPDFRVAYGKFCRTAFGLCREWRNFSGS